MQPDRTGTPEALPAPAVLERWLFEQPWPLMIILLAAALVWLWWAGARGLRTPLRTAPAALAALLAAAVFLLATAVETKRETLLAKTDALIEAAATADAAAVESMLHDQTRVTVLNVGPVIGRDVIGDLVRRYPGQTYPVRSWSVLERQAVVDGVNVARTQVRVRAEVQAFGTNFPSSSWWLIVWTREGENGPWLPTSIECLQIDRVTQIPRL